MSDVKTLTISYKLYKEELRHEGCLAAARTRDRILTAIKELQDGDKKEALLILEEEFCDDSAGLENLLAAISLLDFAKQEWSK